GLPQAEFNLVKQKKKNLYTVEGFMTLPTSTLTIPECLTQLENWATINGIPLEIDIYDSPKTELIIKITQLLTKRGYKQDASDLILNTRRRIQSGQSTSWLKLGSWHRTVQHLDIGTDPAELFKNHIQFDDLQSIAIRLNLPPSQINVKDLVYTPGIHYRLGFIHKAHLKHIIDAWPRNADLSLLDREIVREVQQGKNIKQISLSLDKSPRQVTQRLRFLETIRKVRRKFPGTLGLEECLWIPFETGLDEIVIPTIEKRSDRALLVLISTFLKCNIPLTITQLSKFFGLTKEEIVTLKSRLIADEQVIEGYFLEGVEEIQLTSSNTPDFLTIDQTDVELGQEDEELVSSNLRIDLLPAKDPVTKLHLTPLVMGDASLIPTEREPPGSETWIVFWDGVPVGYLLKIPKKMRNIDYELDIRITMNKASIPIISGTIENMITLMRAWYNQEGSIKSINGLSAIDKHWKPLHFLIESLGIEINASKE
ncbi:MAG: hypothetical protein ACW98K_06455, partial [Candidatus Kariarchaeaceae archaeon]